MAGSYTFFAVIGEDFDRTLTWSTSSIPVSEGGSPVNLSGYTASLTLNGTAGYITTTSGPNGIITLGGSAGTIRLQVPKAALSLLAVGGNAYRLFVTNTQPETSCLLEGTIQMR